MRYLETMRRPTVILLAIVLFVLLLAPLRPGYRAIRAAGRLLPLSQAENVALSANFKLLYAGEQAEAQAMLGLLEAGLADLQQWLPDCTPKPIVVRLHYSQTSLQQALGGGYAPTVGAYYLGKLELLAPRAWWPDLLADDALAHYAKEGPIVHELTHLLLDYQALGQYPVWFTEGLAQYWEMRLRGYVWQEGGNAWRQQPHSLLELTKGFASLPESIAYQEALGLVQFLYESVGDSGMQQLLLSLGQRRPFNVVLPQLYGGSWGSLENEWRAWLLR